jgi:hypothetical protein
MTSLERSRVQPSDVILSEAKDLGAGKLRIADSHRRRRTARGAPTLLGTVLLLACDGG